MSPGTMEIQGLTNQADYDKIRALTKVASPDTAKKITGGIFLCHNNPYFTVHLRHVNGNPIIKIQLYVGSFSYTLQ